MSDQAPALNKPKTITVKDIDGNEKEFIISRLPTTVAREVIAKYPIANIPKVGDYKSSEEVMQLMMKYVAVEIDGREQRLTTRGLIDNHVSDGTQLLRLEIQMFDYNTGFFNLGQGRTFLDFLLEKLTQSVMPMLTPLLAQLSQADSPDSQNSKQP